MKRIVIIGASSGLGRRLALLFASAGWMVGIAARREDLLRDLAAENPDLFRYEPIDVSSSDAPDHLSRLIEKCGGMDVMLYAAGTGWHNPELDPGRELQTLSVNVDGFTRLVTAAFRYFEHNGGGRIAALTSVAGVKGLAVAPAYSASKRFQWNYLQALDQLSLNRRLGIRFTDIRPGFMDTALLADDPGRSRLPLVMYVDYAAPRIFRAIVRGRRVAYIDWRWHTLCALWRRFPNALWRRIRVMF